MAHLPDWLASATEILVARHEAEAVILGGSQVRGDATPASDYDLLVLVDDERNTRQGWPLALRFESLEGYPRPVDYVLASLAEVMAGLYAGHEGWSRFASHLYPIFDPLGVVGRISERASARAQWQSAQTTHLRHEIGRARAILATGDQSGAALIAARVISQLLPPGEPSVDPTTPAIAQSLLSPSIESRLDAVERLLASR